MPAMGIASKAARAQHEASLNGDDAGLNTKFIFLMGLAFYALRVFAHSTSRGMEAVELVLVLPLTPYAPGFRQRLLESPPDRRLGLCGQLPLFVALHPATSGITGMK
jgi:hypothetical protein